MADPVTNQKAGFEIWIGSYDNQSKTKGNSLTQLLFNSFSDVHLRFSILFPLELLQLHKNLSKICHTVEMEHRVGAYLYYLSTTCPLMGKNRGRVSQLSSPSFGGSMWAKLFLKLQLTFFTMQLS